MEQEATEEKHESSLSAYLQMPKKDTEKSAYQHF
jgi:hypothetical protein